MYFLLLQHVVYNKFKNIFIEKINGTMYPLNNYFNLYCFLLDHLILYNKIFLKINS